VTQYQAQRPTSTQRLADAQAQVDDAQTQVDDLKAPDVYALDRTQNEGTVTYDDDTHRMDSIADVFPFIFFLVAALVSLTTMTRMVEDDRVEIGTFKALGYSTARIAEKYLVYAAIAGFSGATLGILALTQVLPRIVMSAYAIIYTAPMLAFPMPVTCRRRSSRVVLAWASRWLLPGSPLSRAYARPPPRSCFRAPPRPASASCSSASRRCGAVSRFHGRLPAATSSATSGASS